MTKPKILLGLPTMGSVHTLLMVRLLDWMADAQRTGAYNLSVCPTMCVQPVDNARNDIVKTFLESDCTHLLFVDSDTIPPANAITKLLAANKPIVSGLTPIIEHNENRKNDSNGFYKKYNCVGQDDKHVETYSGLIPIKGAGGSCILIERSVFEKIEKPYYRFVYQDDSGKEVMVSEDIYFIVKALGAGIQAYADTSVICGHSKPIVW